MNIAVEHHAVDTFAESHVTIGLQVNRRITKQGISRICLRTDNRLIVKQRTMDRIDEGFRRPWIIGVRIIIGRDSCPKFRHRHIAILIGLQNIHGRILRLAIDSFGIHLHTIAMTKVGHVLEVAFFHQVTNGPSKVEEESFGMTTVDERLSTECRQPGTYVVAPTLQEFIGKPLCPRLWPSLPTINEKVSEDTRIDLLCQLKDFLGIIREMHIQGRCIHLVTFQASSFPCSWVIGLAGGRIAET